MFEPEIPPNTGNVMRLCANTGATLHLVHPLGFALDEKKLRRAGMDYRDWAQVIEHDSLDDALASCPGRVFALTTRATTSLYATRFEAGDAVIFGPENPWPTRRISGYQDHRPTSAHTHAAGQPQFEFVELRGGGRLRSLASAVF